MSPPVVGCQAMALSRPRRQRLRDLTSFAVFVVGVLAARSSLADHYRVPSGSMRPTVHEEDHILVNKLAYGLRVPLTHVLLASFAPPARGDVVVLDSPEDGTVLLKRVVAVPGDLVEVSQGEIWIDDKRASRRYSIDLEHGGGPSFGPTRIPPDDFLVLGDNRGDSRDGRFFGWVRRDRILGKAVAICARDGRPRWIGL